MFCNYGIYGVEKVDFFRFLHIFLTGTNLIQKYEKRRTDRGIEVGT